MTGTHHIYDRTWVTEEGSQGEWMWYSEGDGYNIFCDNDWVGRIKPEVTKWCHETWPSAYLMRYYPGTENSSDMLWLKSKKELATFLLKWA